MHWTYACDFKSNGKINLAGLVLRYLQGTILISSDLMVPVAVAVQRSEHDAERTSPLAKEDEEVMS